MKSAQGNWFTRGGWWFFVHVLSVGILSPVPFAAAAVVTRRTRDAVVSVVYLVLVVLYFVLVGTAPKGATGPEGPSVDLGVGLILLVLLGGIVHLIFLRQRVYGDPRDAGPRHDDPSVQAALRARERRTEARKLAVDDPLMAREIRIGRPDLHRTYDDGGLVDLNSAPAGVIAAVLGLENGVGEQIVGARTRAGRFQSVEDAIFYAELPVDTSDLVRDRGIVLRA